MPELTLIDEESADPINEDRVGRYIINPIIFAKIPWVILSRFNSVFHTAMVETLTPNSVIVLCYSPMFNKDTKDEIPFYEIQIAASSAIRITAAIRIIDSETAIKQNNTVIFDIRDELFDIKIDVKSYKDATLKSQTLNGRN